MAYDATEQDVLNRIFLYMLDCATKDGGRKREAGVKVPWWRDDAHEAAIFSHLNKWKHGELVDAASGQHPLVHAAWRCLAIAYQETYGKRDPQTYDFFPGGEPTQPSYADTDEDCCDDDCAYCDFEDFLNDDDDADLVTVEPPGDVITVDDSAVEVKKATETIFSPVARVEDNMSSPYLPPRRCDSTYFKDGVTYQCIRPKFHPQTSATGYSDDFHRNGEYEW